MTPRTRFLRDLEARSGMVAVALGSPEAATWLVLGRCPGCAGRVVLWPLDERGPAEALHVVRARSAAR